VRAGEEAHATNVLQEYAPHSCCLKDERHNKLPIVVCHLFTAGIIKNFT
jgi:hypothetical protein